jgi:hypothetical protein
MLPPGDAYAGYEVQAVDMIRAILNINKRLPSEKGGERWRLTSGDAAAARVAQSARPEHGNIIAEANCKVHTK